MSEVISEKLRGQEQLPILASIGHVCLRWSLLEMAILMVIAALEDIPSEKAFLLYGGQNILPRFDTALRLASYHKAPNPIVKEIKALKGVITKDLIERRNQAVHGAHSDSEASYEVKLTMTRWPEPKRTQKLSFQDFICLGDEIRAAEERTVRVFEEIGAWKFPE
ncbi:MAG: hypothetical protein ABJK59_10735 [Erythrobacter sp.]|uniref:hypothetical protein n=1 Tax=Erythrobacter sp. TaxID=1042 RepID=UPI003296F5BB